MAHEVACSSGSAEQLCPSVCWSDAATDLFSDIYRQGGVPRLVFDQESAALGYPALARGFFLYCVASDTPAAAVGIGQTVDARNSVSFVGSRAANAGERSRG